MHGTIPSTVIRPNVFTYMRGAADACLCRTRAVAALGRSRCGREEATPWPTRGTTRCSTRSPRRPASSSTTRSSVGVVPGHDLAGGAGLAYAHRTDVKGRSSSKRLTLLSPKKLPRPRPVPAVRPGRARRRRCRPPWKLDPLVRGSANPSTSDTIGHVSRSLRPPDPTVQWSSDLVLADRSAVGHVKGCIINACVQTQTAPYLGSRCLRPVTVD